MAKDRFSNQKRSVYDSDFRYGVSYKAGADTGRKPLTEEAVVWLKNLLKKTLSYEVYEFVKSVCKMGKMPTVKQRNKLKLIWKKKHINKIWKRK